MLQNGKFKYEKFRLGVSTSELKCRTLKTSNLLEGESEYGTVHFLKPAHRLQDY
jgi:hypothetical protein